MVKLLKNGQWFYTVKELMQILGVEALRLGQHGIFTDKRLTELERCDECKGTRFQIHEYPDQHIDIVCVNCGEGFGLFYPR